MLFRRDGTSELDADGYLTGAPEFVAEIAASTKHVDLGPKRRAFERLGVSEYLVWITAEDSLRCFRLVDGAFQDADPDADGIWRSATFPGLWLDVPRLLAKDRRGVMAGLRRGMAEAGIRLPDSGS